MNYFFLFSFFNCKENYIVEENDWTPFRPFDYCMYAATLFLWFRLDLITVAKSVYDLRPQQQLFIAKEISINESGSSAQADGTQTENREKCWLLKNFQHHCFRV